MAKEKKIEKLYSLYEKNGLVKNVSMEQFSQATPEQQKKLFDLANSKGLVKEVTFDTFSSAWTPQEEGSKKKILSSPSLDGASVSQEKPSKTVEELEEDYYRLTPDIYDAQKKIESYTKDTTRLDANGNLLFETEEELNDFQSAQDEYQQLINNQNNISDKLNESYKPKKLEDGTEDVTPTWAGRKILEASKGLVSGAAMTFRGINDIGAYIDRLEGLSDEEIKSNSEPLERLATSLDVFAAKNLDTEKYGKDEKYSKMIAEGFGNLGIFLLTGGTVASGATVGALMNTGANVKEAKTKINDAKELTNEEFARKYSIPQEEVVEVKSKLAQKDFKDIEGELILKSSAIGLAEGSVGLIGRTSPFVSKTLGKLNIKTKGGLSNRLRNINKTIDAAESTAVGRLGTGAVTEAAQESFAQLANNAVAKDLYDETRDMFDGVPESALVGGVLGGGLGAFRVRAQDVLNDPNATSEEQNAASKTLQYIKIKEDAAKVLERGGLPYVNKEYSEIQDKKKQLFEAINEERGDVANQAVLDELAKLDERANEILLETNSMYEVMSDKDQIRYDNISNELGYFKNLIDEGVSDVEAEIYQGRINELINERAEIEGRYTDQPVQQTEVFSETEQEVKGEQPTEIIIDEPRFKIPSFNDQKVLKIGDSILDIGQKDENGRWSIIELFVPENQRRKGIASRLIKKAEEIIGDNDFVAQVSNDGSVDLHYKLGFRAFDENGMELTLEQTKERRKDNSSVMMKKTQLTETQENATKEPSAEEVPMGEQPEVSEEVRGEDIRKEETTQEGQEEEIDFAAYEEAVELGNIDESLINELTNEEINRVNQNIQKEVEAEMLRDPDGSGNKFMIIHANLAKIKPSDFDNYGDPNYRKKVKGFNIKYLSKKAPPLDAQAQAMSEEFGIEITPEDVIEYILDRERNPDKYKGLKDKQRKLFLASKIKDSSEAFEIYTNLKGDKNSEEAINALRGTVLSDQQADAIINHLKQRDEKITAQTKQKSNQNIQRTDEALKRVQGKREEEKVVSSPSPDKIMGTPKPQTKAFTNTQFTRIVEQVDKMGIKEGINQARERQKQFSKQAKAVIKNTLKGIKGITKQQYETIASKAAGVKFNSIASLDNFVDYANKVIESADYAVKFENGVKAKSRIKKKAKAKSTLANQRNLANAFGQINPANVDIDKYNEVAKAIEANLSKVKVVEGDVITPERSTTFAIEKQLEELNAQQEEAILAKTAEKNNMTVEELKASLQESKALNTELDNVPENSSEEEYQKARMAIEKKVQAKKQAILDYLSQKVELLDPDGQLGYMTDMELERLSNSDLINMEAIVDNFLKNGVVYNDLRIRSLSSAIKRVPLVLSNPRPVFKKIKGRALKTMGQMVDSYMGGVKVTGELLADLGYFNFQKARESVEKSNTYFKKALFDIIEKGKAKGTRSEKSSAIRQIYAIALQLPEYSSRTGQPIETAFLVFKENLKTTKITLENNGKDNTGYYEAVSEIVDKLDGINSIEDIPISKEDKAIVDKVIDLHKEVEPELAQFIRSAKNKDLPQNPQYLSIQIMGVNEGIFSSNLEETKLSFLDYVLGQNPMPKRSKTLEERGSFKPLKEGEAYNLNFNNVQQSAYYNNLFEARLSEPLMTIQMVTNTKDVKEHLGDNLVNDFRTLLTQEKNQSLVRNSIYTGDNKYVRAGLSVVNTLRNLSVRYIFGRVDQVLRQVPVFLNTPVAITRDFGYSGLYNAFSIRGVIDAVGDREGARKLIDLTTTGRRDLASEVLLTETPTQARVRRFVSDYSGGKIEATTTFLKNFDENVVKKAQMSFLQGTDRYASLSTVVMLYRAYLTNEGVKVFDNSKEADLLAKGDPIRERAMSYAETQMKRDHNVNIREELATLFQTTTSKSTKDLVLQTSFKVVEGLFLPFSRFMLNKKVSMVNDASKLSNSQTRREGAINMVGHTAELFTFAFSASYVTPVILDFVRGLLFDEDEEEKEKRETVTPDELYEQRQRDRKFYTTWISEYSPIAIGDYGTKVTVDGLNFIYFLGDAKLNPDMYESLQGKDFTSKFNSYYRLNQQPLDIYRKYEDASKPFSLGETGVYGIAASAMMQGYSLMTTTNGEYTDAYGNKRFVSEEDADILRKAGLLQFIGAMGYSIGEITFSSMREASEVKRERSYDSEIERAVMNYDIESAINSTVQNLDEFGLIQGKTKSESQVSKAKAKLKMKPNQFFKTAEARSRGNHKELIFLINQRYKELDTKEEKELFESQLLDYIGTENDPLKYYLLDSGKNEILGMVK